MHLSYSFPAALSPRQPLGGLLFWLLLLVGVAPAARAQGYTQVSAGATHSLALRADGTVYAWGGNLYGQLGDGTPSDRLTPQPVSGGEIPAGTRFVQVSAGDYFSMALAANGTIYAWGYNQDGQLGNGTTGFRSTTPVAVLPGAASTPFVQISAGAYALAVAADGRLYAWGNNNGGTLGDGTTTPRSMPVAVAPGTIPAGTRFTQVSAGTYHSLALAADGTAYAWGGNGDGALGDGTLTRRLTPVAVAPGTAPAGTRFTQLSAGSGHSLALAADGTVYAWGYNGYGTLGDGTTTNRPLPGAVVPGGAPAGTRFTQVAAGRAHSLALAANGTIYAWGENSYGQLGDNSATQRDAPVREFTTGTGWTAVASGSDSYHSLALGPQRAVFAAGSNGYGQFGDGSRTSSVVFVRNAAPLPVELTAFAATAEGDRAVRLTWATASEHSSAHFVVERSTNGEAFAPLVTVAAAGTSSSPRTYAYRDEQLPAAAQLYYRLRQVDADGTAAYSPVRAVAGPGGAAFALLPNPAPGATTAHGLAAGTVLHVFDALGREVARATADATGSAPLLLPTGLYLVRSSGRAVRLVVE